MWYQADQQIRMGEMRLLHTIAGLQEGSGGPARATLTLCDELAKLGASVEIVTQRSRQLEGNHASPSLERTAIRFVDCCYLPKLRVAYSPHFRSVVREACDVRKIEILHDNGIWLPANRAAVGVARETGIPLVISPHGMLKPWSLSHRAWKKKIAWMLYQKRDLAAARVLCATSMEEATSLRECGREQAVAVVPIGVHLPELKGRQCEKPNPRTALFVSRIHPVKGLLLLVEAWKRVRPRDWRVIVAGPDEEGHRRVVEKAVGAAGLERQFEFVGPVGDEAKETLLQGADFLILPTMSENFGVVVAEALANCLPVITTTGAPWRGLVDHSCGWWVRPEASELAHAIHEATGLSDKERETMGARGRLWMEREFSWPSMAQRMLSVYEWILSGGDVPGCVIEGPRVSYSIATRSDLSQGSA
jgi:glycosyltransferase involved in cell wall biosynthesis